MKYKGKLYVEDPKGTFGWDHLTSAFTEHAMLPADATPTGFHSDGSSLWTSVSDTDAIYIVQGSDARRLPKGGFELRVYLVSP